MKQTTCVYAEFGNSSKIEFVVPASVVARKQERERHNKGVSSKSLKNDVTSTAGTDTDNDDNDEDDDVVRDWIWENFQDEIKKSLRFVQNVDQLAIEKANHRLKLLDKISQVQRQYLLKEEPKIVFGGLLDCLLEMMDSEYGMIGELQFDEDDGSPFLLTHAVTNIAWNDFTRQFYEDNIATGLKFRNMNTLFGTVLMTGETVIANEPATHLKANGIPDGHPPLTHFLGIPFFVQGGKQLSGMVGIANKPGGYTQEDVDFLEPLVVTCSNLIQAYNTNRENEFLINKLEDLVVLRTNELEMANEKIVEAAKMQIEHFACMSHEIRTPLNCVIGLSSLLQETPLSLVQEDSLQMIIKSGELLMAVVNDVLDFSKLQTNNMIMEIVESSLQDTLDAVVHSIESKARDKNLRFKTMYDHTIPDRVFTDSRRLQQILYNLLGNAIKFSKENGCVEFTVLMCKVDGSGDEDDKNDKEDFALQGRTDLNFYSSVSSSKISKNLPSCSSESSFHDDETSVAEAKVSEAVYYPPTNDVLKQKNGNRSPQPRSWQTPSDGSFRYVRSETETEAETETCMSEDSHRSVLNGTRSCPLPRSTPTYETQATTSSPDAVASFKSRCPFARSLSTPAMGSEFEESLFLRNEEEVRIGSIAAVAGNDNDESNSIQADVQNDDFDDLQQSRCPFTSSSGHGVPPLSYSQAPQPEFNPSRHRYPFLKQKSNQVSETTSYTSEDLDEAMKSISQYHSAVIERDHDNIVYGDDGMPVDPRNDKSSKYRLRFIVKDYGKGIAKSDFHKIFQPFQQASGPACKSVQEGTGLGLAITSRLIKGLGGEISVDSELGKYAQFTLDFPLLRGDGPIDVKALGQKIKSKNVRLFLVGNLTARSANLEEFVTVNDVEHFHCADCESLVQKVAEAASANGVSEIDAVNVILMHEDLYRKELYSNLDKDYKAVLITFGPNYSVPDSIKHFRSLPRTLPSVVWNAIDSCVSEVRSMSDSMLLQRSQVNKKNSCLNNTASDYAHMSVLVAEDNIVNQKVLLQILNRVGVTKVDIVNNGKEAYDKTGLKDYNLILMDMQMPVMDGVDASRLIVHRHRTDKMHQNRKKPHIVFVTAHSSRDFEAMAKEAGGSGYITKPFTLQMIRNFFQKLPRDVVLDS